MGKGRDKFSSLHGSDWISMGRLMNVRADYKADDSTTPTCCIQRQNQIGVTNVNDVINS